MTRVTIRRADAHDLPPVCCVCGEAATRTRFETLNWNPSWVGILLFVGFVPWILALWLTRWTADLTLPVCDRHARRSRRAWGVLAVGFLLGSSAVAASILIGERTETGNNLLVGGVVAMGLAVLAAVCTTDDRARAGGIDKRTVILERVSAAFVKAVEGGARGPERRAAVPAGGMELATARYYRG